MVKRRLTNSIVGQFARGGAGMGSTGAPLALVHGTRTVAHGARILRAVATLSGLRANSRFGHVARTTHAARI